MAKKKIMLGKIAINPRGNYSNSEKYTKLDLVSYGGIGWVCRKDCIGITPCNCENWMQIGVAGEGQKIVIDDAFSSTSTNSLQNRVITEKFNSLDEELKGKAVTLKYENDTLSLLDSEGNILKSVKITQGQQIVLDDELSLTSENGLKNKVITAELNKKAEDFSYVDNVFSLLDGNGKVIRSATIQSGGESPITIDTELDKESNNAIANSAVVNALEYKVNSVDGMGLSHNDFTDTYKEAIDGMQILTSDVTYYVSTDGNDENDGSESAPFATLQKAISKVPHNLCGNNFNIIIKQGEYTILEDSSSFKIEKYRNGVLSICGESYENMPTINTPNMGAGLYFENIDELELKNIAFSSIRTIRCKRLHCEYLKTIVGPLYMVETTARLESFKGNTNYPPILGVAYGSFCSTTYIKGTSQKAGSAVSISRGILVCDSIEVTGTTSQYTIYGSGKCFIGNS